MPQMTERELLAVVNAEFDDAMGAPDGEISTDRAEAWDYYLSKPFGNEIEGQSQIVTSDVSDVVDGIIPSLLRIFTTADNLAEFEPVDKDDIAPAQQESDYVNYVFFKRNPAFLILYTWVFDALVQKNGIVKAWWDVSKEVTTESYQGLTEGELAELMDDDELEAVERAEKEGMVPVEVEPGVFVETPATLHDVEFKRTSKTGRARVEPVPPGEYRISADSRSVDPRDARMVGQEREITRSELMEMGFSKDLVDDLPAYGDPEESEEELSRRDKSEETDDAPHDKSQEKILVKEAYIKVDYDGDGFSELRQVFTAGHKILSNEEVDRQPFHVISPQPLPHKHFGRATAEKVMDTQLVNSTLRRQILDNLYLTNNPEQNVWEMGMGEDTLDDLLTRRAGKVNRFSRPPAESYSVNEVPFTAGSTFPYLELLEKEKRDRTGIAADSEGLSPDALKNIQTSVLAQAFDMSRQKIEAIARIFAETGIKSLFLHLHELLMKHQDKVDVVRLRNEFVPVNPQEWRTRKNMTVQIGLGVGTREQNLIHLDAIWQKQSEMIDKGGMGLTVTPKNLYNTAAEFVKNANLKTPQMFFSDPGDQMPQQQPDPQVEALKAQIQVQMQEMQNDRERNLLQHQREIAKIEQNQQKIENDLLVKMEEIATQLTKLELDAGQNVPGAKV